MKMRIVLCASMMFAAINIVGSYAPLCSNGLQFIHGDGAIHNAANRRYCDLLNAIPRTKENVFEFMVVGKLYVATTEAYGATPDSPRDARNRRNLLPEARLLVEAYKERSSCPQMREAMEQMLICANCAEKWANVCIGNYK